jgi:hypothetical protein
VDRPDRVALVQGGEELARIKSDHLRWGTSRTARLRRHRVALIRRLSAWRSPAGPDSGGMSLPPLLSSVSFFRPPLLCLSKRIRCSVWALSGCGASIRHAALTARVLRKDRPCSRRTEFLGSTAVRFDPSSPQPPLEDRGGSGARREWRKRGRRGKGRRMKCRRRRWQ